MVLLDSGCAEPLGDADSVRGLVLCGLPLEAVDSRVLPSTGGPMAHLSVQCPRGHRYTHVPSLADRDDSPGGAAEAA